MKNRIPKKYTREQLKEAVSKWEAILEERLLTEATESRDGDPVPKQDLKTFVDGLAREVSQGLKEADGELSEADLKVKIYEFISTLKTKEDLEEFIKNNKVQMEGLRRDKSAPSKVKSALLKIWDILCKVVKFSFFCLEHIKTLAVFAAVIFICIKFEVTPIQAITKTVEAAKVVWQAADVTLTGAKRAADTYGAVQDTSETIGDKVGEIIGKGIGHSENAASKVKSWFKPTPKKAYK